MDENEEMCQICDAYDNYLFLQQKGYEEEESFHEAVSYMVESLIESLLELGYEDGFRDGLVHTFRDISSHTSELADAIESHSVDKCTCDEITVEESQCGVDCGCYDGECPFEDDLKMEDEPKEFLYGEEFAQWLKDRM